MRIRSILLIVVVGAIACFGAWAEEAPQAATAAVEKPSDLKVALLALSAALAIGMTALATGLAQSRIGAAGAGSIAEKPETAGTIILLVAIPETMVILGFVVAVVILFVL
jgi:V/A-type H+/Na+-transporting ATPase subunit K